MEIMHVSLLEIGGFRGVKSARLVLGSHVVLLDANNVGKSAIVDALALVLGRKGLVRDLWEHDFFGSSPEAKDRIHLRATITGFEPDDADSHPRFFADASHVWWLDEKQDVAFGERPEGATLALQVGFSARFDLETAEVVTSRYFVDGDTDPFDDSVRPVRSEHLQDLGFFASPVLAEALRRARRQYCIRGLSHVAPDALEEDVMGILRTMLIFGRVGERSGRVAMTIKAAKNQEFRNVAVLWPHKIGGDVLFRRKLLYNGITRAMERAVVIVQGGSKKAPELRLLTNT